jgi:hypothetical protein
MFLKEKDQPNVLGQSVFYGLKDNFKETVG